MKDRARLLIRQARCLAEASTLGDDRRLEIARLHGEADRLLRERAQKQANLERAATRPATHHTVQAWGAAEGEPNFLFPRALRRSLLDMGATKVDADQIVDSAGQGDKGGG